MRLADQQQRPKVRCWRNVEVFDPFRLPGRGSTVALGWLNHSGQVYRILSAQTMQAPLSLNCL